MKNRKDGIVFAGTMLVDHIKTVAEYPKEGQLAPILKAEDCPGGLVCNTAVDFAALNPDIPVYACGKIGCDRDGDRILELLREHKIDVSLIEREGVTSYTDVISTPHQRTFFQYGGACDTFDLCEKDIKNLPGRALHIGYILLLKRLDAPDALYRTGMARVLHAAKKAGFQTSVDMVTENAARYSEVVLPALPYVDILVLNEVEAGNAVGFSLRDEKELIPDRVVNALKYLIQAGVQKWVVIHSPEGAYGMDTAGNIAFSPSAPLPAGYIAGKVGAGDAFCSGVLLASYRELSLENALLYGNAAAQVSLRSSTATGSMTSIEEALKEYHRYLNG